MPRDKQQGLPSGRDMVDELPRLLTLKEAASVLRLGRTWLAKRIRTGEIKGVVLGGQYLIEIEEIKRLIREGSKCFRGVPQSGA